MRARGVGTQLATPNRAPASASRQGKLRQAFTTVTELFRELRRPVAVSNADWDSDGFAPDLVKRRPLQACLCVMRVVLAEPVHANADRRTLGN